MRQVPPLPRLHRRRANLRQRGHRHFGPVRTRAAAPGGAANPDDWAAFLWASRLAYADRDHYMADDKFAPVPTRELIAPAYLDQRARLIDLAHAPTRS